MRAELEDKVDILTDTAVARILTTTRRADAPGRPRGDGQRRPELPRRCRVTGVTTADGEATRARR